MLEEGIGAFDQAMKETKLEHTFDCLVIGGIQYACNTTVEGIRRHIFGNA